MGETNFRIRSSRELGQLITVARRQQGMSQRQVADALGVSQAWVSRVEQGKQRAWVGNVLRLASFLDIELQGRLPREKGKRDKPVAISAYPDINSIVD